MVKNLVLENIGDINYLELKFNSGVNFIETKHRDAIAFAIGYITNNLPLSQAFPILLRKNSCIYSQVQFDHIYTFDTQNPVENKKISSLFEQSREEDRLCFFQKDKFIDYSSKLEEYRDFEYFYTKKRFFIDTKSACISKTFRSYLKKYIKDFKPQKLTPLKNFYINLNQNGRFFVEGNPFLSQSEKTLFDFLSFLNILEFWKRFEEIKDFNHNLKPIFITELFEKIDQANPKDYVIERLKSLDRQIFLIEKAK